MKIYFDKDGRFVKATGSSIFKQSNLSDYLQVKADFPQDQVVNATFLLPYPKGSSQYGNYSAESLLLQVVQDTVDGGFMWQGQLLSGYLQTDGLAYVSARFQTNGGVVIKTTEQVKFVIEPSGDYTATAVLPEQADQILAQLANQASQILDLQNLKQDKADDNLQTTAKTVVGAINENRDNIIIVDGNATTAVDLSNQAKTTADEALQLAQQAITQEYGVGTLTTNTLVDIDNQLNAFVLQKTGRATKIGDVVIVVLEIPNATDKNYKYSYGSVGWYGYEIPPIEKASNGTYGIIQGTYGIPSLAHQVLVDIVDGQIENIWVNNDITYQTLGSWLRTNSTNISQNATDIANIISGATRVGNSLRLNSKLENQLNVNSSVYATKDVIGNTINEYYLDKQSGATKEYVQDYALPKTFADVFYVSASGFVDTIPTTPPNGIQFTVTTSAVGSTTVAQIPRTLTAKYTFSSRNSISNDFWLATDRAISVDFRLTTSVKKASETNWTDLSINLSDTLVFVANTPQRVSFKSYFDLLGNNELDLEVGDNFRQTLEVITTTSTATVFNLYCNTVRPSTMALDTQTTVITVNTIGEPKQIPLVASQFILNQTTGLYEASISQETHMQPIRNDYLIWGTYASGTLNYKVNVDSSVDDGGNIVIYAEQPQDLTIFIATKFSTDQKGILTITNPTNLASVDFDIYGAIKITQNVTPTPLILGTPTSANLPYSLFVFNDTTSTQPIQVDGNTIEVGKGIAFEWVGSWVVVSAIEGIFVTQAYVDDQDLAFIGREQQIDMDGTLVGDTITFQLETAISTFDFKNSTCYLFYLHLPLTTLTGDLNNSYKMRLLDKDGNVVNLNCVTQEDITQTATIGDLCDIQDYKEDTGYEWRFYAHYKQLSNGGTTVRVAYTDAVTKPRVTALKGSEIYTRIANATLPKNGVVVCTETYSANGTTFQKGHYYFVKNEWVGGLLQQDTTDITVLPKRKNITNESGVETTTVSGGKFTVTIADTDVTPNTNVDLNAGDVATYQFLQNSLDTNIITENNGSFSFVLKSALPTTWALKYIVTEVN